MLQKQGFFSTLFLYRTQVKESGLGYIDPKQNRVITTHGFRSTFRD